MPRILGEIIRKRGDTYPFTITIKGGGVPVDFTGYQEITMSLNTLRAPVDISTELFNLKGTFDADRKNGRVTFALTEIQADNLGKYYYEIQSIDAIGGKRTYEIPIDSATQQPGNVFVFVQDINKE